MIDEIKVEYYLKQRMKMKLMKEKQVATFEKNNVVTETKKSSNRNEICDI